MLRAVIGVIVGYTVWTAIWLGGNAVLFGEAAETVGAGERYEATGSLVGVIVLSVVCSLVAGLCCAAIASGKARGAVLVLAVLLLLTGIAVQGSVWSLMPAWYHLTFLVLLAPFTIAGGLLAGRKPTPA